MKYALIIALLLAGCTTTKIKRAEAPYRGGVLDVGPAEYMPQVVAAIQRGEQILGRPWTGTYWGWTFNKGARQEPSKWTGEMVPVFKEGAVCQSTPRGKRCGTLVALRPDGTASMPHMIVESGWGIQSSNGFGDWSNPMDPAAGGTLPNLKGK